jgi:hypothetical protein
MDERLQYLLETVVHEKAECPQGTQPFGFLPANPPSPWTICAKSRESANIISFACSKNMSEPHRANISGIKDYNWQSSCFVIPKKTSSPSLWSPGSTAFLLLNGRLEKKVWNQSVRVSQKVISLRLVFLLFWSHPRRVP